MVGGRAPTEPQARSSPSTPVAMSEAPSFLRSRPLSLLALALLCACLYGYRLGARDFETSDEARRALVTRAMVASGDYAIPTLSGHPYLQKPPLYYWLASLAEKAFRSKDEWVYRLPSAVAAAGSVLILFLMADPLLGRRGAFLAAVMLATCPMFVIYGARAGIDMTLCLVVTLAIFCLVRAREGDWRGWAPWGFWACLGLAFLVKGPVGLVFPLAAAAALAAGPGFRTEVGRMRPLLGALLAAAIVLPWGALIIERIGFHAAIALVREEVLGGFGEEATRHAKSFLFYLYDTPAHFLPWTFLLPAGILAIREASSTRERRALRVAGAWLLPALVIFSLSHQKRSYYLLPSFGALALWLGWTADRFLFSPPASVDRAVVRRLAKLGLLAATGAAALGALVGAAYLRSRRPGLSEALGIPLVAVALWALFGFVSLRRGRPGRAVVAVVACAVLYAATARGPLAAWLNRRDSHRLAAQAIARAVPQEADLVSLFRSELFIEAYVGRPVTRIDADRELRRRLAGKRPVYVLLQRKLYPERKDLFRRVVIPSIGEDAGKPELMLASN